MMSTSCMCCLLDRRCSMSYHSGWNNSSFRRCWNNGTSCRWKHLSHSHESSNDCPTNVVSVHWNTSDEHTAQTYLAVVSRACDGVARGSRVSARDRASIASIASIGRHVEIEWGATWVIFFSFSSRRYELKWFLLDFWCWLRASEGSQGNGVRERGWHSLEQWQWPPQLA